MGLIFDLVALAAIVGAVVWLCGRMRESDEEKPPYVRLSLVLVTYGLALWFIAGMFLGATVLAVYVPVFLLLAAPLIMLAVAILTFRERKVSAFHHAACLASIGYFYLLVGALVLLAKSCPAPTGGPP